MKKLLLALTISGLALSAAPATAHAWSPYGDDAVMGHQPAPSYLKDLPADENPDVYTGYDFSQYDITHKPGAPKPEKQYADVAYGYYDDYGYWHYYVDAYGYPMYYYYGSYYYY